MTYPAISVVIPVFNGAAFLRQAIESVLCQTRPAFEIHVLDDGSTDETPAILASFKNRILVTVLAHGGADAARNAGIKMTRGDFIAFCDADDLMTPDRLALQVRALKDKSEVDFVFGNLVEFEGSAPSFSDPSWTSRRKAGVCVGTLMARRTALDEVGPFATRWKMAGFMEWYFRIQDGGFKSSVLDDVVLLRRIHGANLSLTESGAMALEYAQVIKLRSDKKRGKLL